jgi:predicted GNAT superfamily acetyltransferase
MPWTTAAEIRNKILTPQVLERRGFGNDGMPLPSNDKTFGNRISSLAKQNTAAAERQASEDTKNVRREAIKIRESSTNKGANWIKMVPNDPRRTTFNTGRDITDTISSTYSNIYTFLTTDISADLQTNYNIIIGDDSYPSGLQWINSNTKEKEGTRFDTLIVNSALSDAINAKRVAINADLSTHEFDFTAEEWAAFQISVGDNPGDLTYNHYITVEGDNYQPLQPKATKNHTINKYHIVDADVDENYLETGTGTEYVLVGTQEAPNVDIAGIIDASNIKYGDYISPNTSNYVWVLSRSTEDEREYQRTNERDVKELRRRCIRIREKKTDGSKIGQIWIKMKENDPRRTETVNIGTELTPEAATIQVLTNNASAFAASHTYYGKYFVVDSKIDSEHNYIVRNSPTGFEYVFDNGNIPTITDVSIAYGDFYKSGNDVWVVSRSTEDEREYQRTIEKNVKELRRRCIRIREKKTDSTKIGQIWIKMKENDPRRTDTVNIGTPIDPHTSIKEVLTNNASAFDASHTYYGKYFVVDSKIDSEHNYIVRNSPTGFEYVFDNNFNLLEIDNITVSNNGTGYGSNQVVGLVITVSDGINPIISAVATVTANDVGEITSSSTVNITKNGLGYYGDITVTSSQNAEFLVILGEGGIITSIDVTRQGVGYAPGELSLTFGGTGAGAAATLDVPDSGIIDIGSNITITGQGANYVEGQTTATLGVNPGNAATFDVTLNNIYEYGDYYYPNTSNSEGFVWVVSRSTEDEREYQRTIERDVKELRRRCIRIRENSTTIGQIWIKMKENDPRRTETVNIGTERTPDAVTIQVLTNNALAFDTDHAYYGKYFVVDSKIDSEHNYVVRNSPTGFEYVFDNENGPTITIADGGTLAYGDYYKDGDDVWVVSRSTESEREYQRIIEKEVKELRRSCIRHRENSTIIGQIWIKEPVDAVEIQGYKYVNKTSELDAKLKEVFANKPDVFALGHNYYRQFFVVDSHIDSEHDYVVRNSPSGITYVFNNMTMTELNSFNTTLDYGNYFKLGDSISEITVADAALNYKVGQIISLVINPTDGITPIIAASATITVPAGGINNTTPVTITEKGLGYNSNTLATIISSQVAEFLVTIGVGGKIDSIDVIRQGVGYADGELNLTITDNASTATEAATAKVNVPSTGIIDIGSSNDIGSSIEITAEGAGYTTENVTATLDTQPGAPIVFTVTQSSSTDRFVVSRSTEVMREYMKSIEVSREAAREMYRLQEGISLLNNLEAWDPENRIGRIWIYVSDTKPSTGTEITDSIYPGFPNSLMYGVPSGYSWYKYGSVAPNNVSVIFNDASVGATGTADEGKITEITISGAGSGYTPGEIIDLTITDKKTPTILATAIVAVDSNGDIASGSNITVTDVGAGYSGNVSVTLPLPEGSAGTEAKFNATVTNGSIAIAISEAGSGYTANTNATLIITDNGGNGASATVTVNFDGTIKTTNAVQITNSGSGYSPKVSVSCNIAPNNQVPLEKSELATALALRQDFTPSEWNSFGITDLTNDHYIHVDPDYYKPVPGKLIYTSEELDQYGLNTIDSTYWVSNTGTTVHRNGGYFIPSYHINQNYKNLQYPSNVLNNILGRVWLKVDKIPTDGNAYTSADLKGELDKGILSFTLDRLDELGIVSAYSSGLNWKGVNTLPSSGILFTDSGLTSLLDGNGEVDSVKTITKSEWDGLAIDIGLTENHYIIGSNSKYYKPVNKNTLNNTHYIVGATGYYYVPGYWVNSTFKDAYYPLVDPSQ